MKKIKQKKLKADYIPLSLFQIMYNHWEEMESFRKKLSKYLDENYKMKTSCTSYASNIGDKKPYPSDEAWEDFVNNCLWDNEFDAEKFNKELKKYSIKK